MFKRSTIDCLVRWYISVEKRHQCQPSSVSNTYSWTQITGNLKTQCQKERDIALSPFITDIFVPLCDGEGMFVPLQCFEHDTYGKQCWCVDSSGQEIQGTRMDNGTAPECGECKQKSNLSKGNFTVVDVVTTWSINTKKAWGDLAFIRTSLLFLLKCQLPSIRKTWFTQEKQWGIYRNKVSCGLTTIQRPGH